MRQIVPSLAYAWNAHGIDNWVDRGIAQASGGSMSGYSTSITFAERLRVAGMWLFLAPLILMLGTLDVLTNGRSRSWPLGEQPREDRPR